MKQAHIATGTLYVELLFDLMKSGVFILQTSSPILSYHNLYTRTRTGAIQGNHWPVAGAQTQNGHHTKCRLQQNDIR